MELFVPGRICLFGEHSDWAASYRPRNPAIAAGCALLVGTDQGLHARVAPFRDQLQLRSTLDDGSRTPWWRVPMDAGALLQVAQRGGFHSYAAGVAWQALRRHGVGGLKIDNHRTDLPIRKGLSSSAALCVLLARAFSRLYDLGLSRRDEMELAYLGETATPSQCGRLDQGCAYGRQPIRMRFDGEALEVEPLQVGATVFMAIADLGAEKDTHRILADLNRCYPMARDPVQRGVQRLLGPENARIVAAAEQALAAGDAAALGALMNEAQALFDQLAAPACPSQLRAPALHCLLSHEALQPWIHGGKGVGSQGDGSVQLVTRDEGAQERLLEILRGQLGLRAWPLRLVRSGGQQGSGAGGGPGAGKWEP